MTNPQLTRSLLEVIRSLPDADRLWLQEQLGQDSGELSSDELAQMALTGQAFHDLAQEPDLYSFSDGISLHGWAQHQAPPGDGDLPE